MALITKEEAMAFLGLDSTTSAQEKQLAGLVNQVSAAVASHCDRQLEYAEATEVYDGNGKFRLRLNRWPIDSITSVTYTDENETAKVLAETDYDFYAEEGILRLKPKASFAMIFLRGARAWSVRYKAGYKTDGVPQDLKLACLTWLAIIFQRIEHKLHAVQSRSFGDENVSYRFDKIPPDVEALLESYVRPPYA